MKSIWSLAGLGTVPDLEREVSDLSCSTARAGVGGGRVSEHDSYEVGTLRYTTIGSGDFASDYEGPRPLDLT